MKKPLIHRGSLPAPSSPDLLNTQTWTGFIQNHIQQQRNPRAFNLPPPVLLPPSLLSFFLPPSSLLPWDLGTRLRSSGAQSHSFLLISAADFLVPPQPGGPGQVQNLSAGGGCWLNSSQDKSGVRVRGGSELSRTFVLLSNITGRIQFVLVLDRF